MYTGSVERDDALLEEIDAEVARNNGNREWVMTMFDSITIAEQEARVRGHLQGLEEGREKGLREGHQEGLKQGMKQGLEEGQSRYAKLVDKLLDLGRVDDLKTANKDPELASVCSKNSGYRTAYGHTMRLHEQPFAGPFVLSCCRPWVAPKLIARRSTAWNEAAVYGFRGGRSG